MAAQICDIVMEGGGVKGIGLVGALSVLSASGYNFRRIAGTSAGAIVGSLVAAGIPVSALEKLMSDIRYGEFRDEGFLDRLGFIGKGLSLVFEKGVYEGEALREWLKDQLAQAGVHTFGDLKVEEDWCQQVPAEQRYRLVVIVADVSRGRLVRLPWDYKDYGLDPDSQSVADAVRASMSIPFFYEPVRMKGNYLVDGGILSNFPIDLFDSTPDHPTFGIKLSAKPEANLAVNPVRNSVELARAVIATMANAHDMMHLDDPCTIDRTMFVDTMKIKPTDFDISPKHQKQLFLSGQKGAAAFLKRWSPEHHQRICQAHSPLEA
ncbi:MAG: patatin-like phospholipase family protein [Candidatus Saccharimonadales bacterium]